MSFVFVFVVVKVVEWGRGGKAQVLGAVVDGGLE